MSWEITQKESQLVVIGEVSAENVEEFCCDLLQKYTSEQSLHLLDFDIVDGVAMARMISTLRTMLPLKIFFAPQMLAHTLYKIGMLSRASVVLINPRYDEN